MKDADVMAGPTRIGAVSFLNTTPLIEGLEKLREVELTLAPPSALIGKLIAGEVDVALAPIIDAQLAQEDVVLMPAGAIGCDGATRTVQLYVRGDAADVKKLYADADSHTSVALARIVLARNYGATPDVVTVDARERAREGIGAGEAVLMIGDKVVTSPPAEANKLTSVDLGEAWKKLTGLPFVYAVWMCLASRADEEMMRSAAQLLERQRLHNRTRLGWIVSERAQEHGWGAGEAGEYLGDCIRHDLGEEQREAIERFFDEAAALGVIGERRMTRWL